MSADEPVIPDDLPRADEHAGGAPERPGPGAREPESPARRTLPPHFRTKSPHTDTAGTPWAGRDYAESPFPGDDGSAPPRLAAALAGTRVLVPIMAVATEKGTTAHGLVGDNGADMAMVSITAADGARALPLFSSVASLAAWRADARPVPVIAEQAAQAAVSEGCTSLLLDPAENGGVLLSRSALWALAQGRAWIPPHEDPELARELDAIAERVPGVISVTPGPGGSREVDLRVTLVAGLDAPRMQTVVAAFGQELSRSALVAERITSLRLSLTA